MNLKARDIIGVGIASLLVFPVVFFAVLLGTGVAHLEFSDTSVLKEQLSGYLERFDSEQQQFDKEQSNLYKANVKMADSLEQAKKEIQEEIARLEALRAENAQLRNEVFAERERIDKLVDESKSLSEQKVQELAEVYGSMKPVEAAPILLNLDNVSIARIIKRVPEVRAQAKLMAAIGAMDNRRAANITKTLGWKKEGL
ncbi:MAG: hypothetical protein GX801_00070 [Fibrobacter sp.]|nr:hypothetical protein [Fibrobacter sp.]